MNTKRAPGRAVGGPQVPKSVPTLVSGGPVPTTYDSTDGTSWVRHAEHAPWELRSRQGLLSAAGGELTGIATEVEVTHQGQVTGWLRLVRPSGDLLRAREERLLSDLAHQAGMILEQARLTGELRVSRRRLAAAQNQERELIERDLHDGAQQHLLALSARIGMLPEDQAGQMREDVAAAMDSLRDVARGVYPKLLETGGLRPALSAQARRLPIPVKVAVAAERLPRDVEVAIYYCCSEALQNVARHSGARRAQLTVTNAEGVVQFEIADNGCGLIPAGAAAGNGTGEASGAGLRNMRDRVEALDVRSRSTPIPAKARPSEVGSLSRYDSQQVVEPGSLGRFQLESC